MQLTPRTIDMLLTADELTVCRDVGLARHSTHTSVEDGRVDQNRTSEEIHVQGAIGEFAFAKRFNLPWTGRLWTHSEWQTHRSAADVGDVEVKTRPQGWHGLLVKQDEAALLPEKSYVLALTHKLPTVVLAGWCMKSAICSPFRWKGWLPSPAFLIEQSELAPMATLIYRLRALDPLTRARTT